VGLAVRDGKAGARDRGFRPTSRLFDSAFPTFGIKFRSQFRRLGEVG